MDLATIATPTQLPSAKRQNSSMAEAAVATEFFCPSRFLSKSSIEHSERTVPMSDMVGVGNRMVYCGIGTVDHPITL